MTIDVLDKLYESGDLRTLVNAGIVSTSVLNYRKIYHAYTERIESGRKKMEALDDISFVFDTSYVTIYKVLKIMRNETE